MNTNNVDISIIIVNYNTKALTLDCLRSIYASETTYRYEVIVVDNASHDGTVEAIRAQFAGVRCIENEANVGFSKANNLGINVALGQYILLLNSDTVIEPSTLQVMGDYMEGRPEVGASGCKLVLADGTLDKACKRGFPTPSASFYYAFGLSKLFPNVQRFNRYQLGYLDEDEEHEIDSLVGAFMLVRREAIEQVGLLDETFFMYGEDIDWCYRIKQAGWHIMYYPRTTVVHYKGASSRRKPFKIVYEFHRAMVVFHRKHYAKQYAGLVNSFVYLGIGVKFLAATVVNSMKTLIRRG